MCFMCFMLDKTAKLAIDFYRKLGPEGMASLTDKRKDKALLKYIIKFLKKSDKVLDLACGYGRITIPLAKKGYRIEGLDISPNLIKEAKKRAKKLRLKLKFKIADMRALPYKDNSFDKILCLWSSFNHLLTFKDQLRAINEIYRVLREKGVCIIELPNLESKWARVNVKKYGRRPPFFINGLKVINYVHDRSTLNKLAKKSKFKKYKIKFANIAGRRRTIFILGK
ncbi:MAG: class I SAM-dependent methyltransferase [Candidatus Pacearchaeota archaeon]